MHLRKRDFCLYKVSGVVFFFAVVVLFYIECSVYPVCPQYANSQIHIKRLCLYKYYIYVYENIICFFKDSVEVDVSNIKRSLILFGLYDLNHGMSMILLMLLNLLLT